MRAGVDAAAAPGGAATADVARSESADQFRLTSSSRISPSG
jgi:hypothetical protein